MSVRRIVYMLGAVSCCITSADADTISGALARAYNTNPQLNAQRANTRAVDENYPIAFGSFLPTAQGQGSLGILRQGLHFPSITDLNGNTSRAYTNWTLTHPSSAGVVVNLNIFNGFRSINGINQAAAQIRQSRAQLKYTENIVLNQGASAYLGVLRATAVYALRSNNVQVLERQVAITKERLEGGEVTSTDLFQAKTALAQGQQDQQASYVTLQASIATYKQQIGVAPGELRPARPLGALLPASRAEAIQIADAENPLIQAAKFNVEVADFQVKLIAGQLAPTLGLTGGVTSYRDYAGTRLERLYQAQVTAQLNVPLYEGGVVYGQVRQAKEKLAEARLLSDQQTDQVHQTVESTWANWAEADGILKAAQRQVKFAESALAGVREEAKFGQRTTQDILNAQLTLVNARIAAVAAQHDLTLSSYALLASMGRLTAPILQLDVATYDPKEHAKRVKYQFIGTTDW
ncbi:MAG: TolC family outer membrane protein [Beijerinckiaceae bacterium]